MSASIGFGLSAVYGRARSYCLVVATPQVLVVGAGPTGLMLACELALGGVNARLLEERTDTPNITRAFAVHARTLELLDARGLAEELIPRGMPVYEIAPPGGATLDLGELPTRFGMVLMVPQSGTERVLQTRAEANGRRDRPRRRGGRPDAGRRRRGVELAGGDTVRADYAVGCDGAHSAVRSLAGHRLRRQAVRDTILLADVRLTPARARPVRQDESEGVVLFVPFGDGWFRAIAWDRLREQAPL